VSSCVLCRLAAGWPPPPKTPPPPPHTLLCPYTVNRHTPVVCGHHLLLGLPLAERNECLDVLHTPEGLRPHLQLTRSLELLKARLQEQVQALRLCDVTLLTVPGGGWGGTEMATCVSVLCVEEDVSDRAGNICGENMGVLQPMLVWVPQPLHTYTQ
jgi:hypothetical protein